MDKGPNQDEHKPAEKPISLHPLKVEEAIAGLLKVKPRRKNDGDGDDETRPGSASD